MTGPHRPDDEETSVYAVGELPPPVIAPAAIPVQPPAVAVPPAVMPPLYPPYQRPALPGTAARVVLAGLLLLVLGIGELLGGAIGAVVANSLRRVFTDWLKTFGLRGAADNAAPLTNLLAAIFVTMLILGVLQIVASVGVLSHRRWGRWLGVLLSIVGVLIGGWLVYRVAQGGSPRPSEYSLPLALLIAYAVPLLALIFPGDHFRSRR